MSASRSHASHGQYRPFEALVEIVAEGQVFQAPGEFLQELLAAESCYPRQPF